MGVRGSVGGGRFPSRPSHQDHDPQDSLPWAAAGALAEVPELTHRRNLLGWLRLGWLKIVSNLSTENKPTLHATGGAGLGLLRGLRAGGVPANGPQARAPGIITIYYTYNYYYVNYIYIYIYIYIYVL